MYMEDEMKEIIDNFKEKGEKTIALLTGELNSVRAGRANPSFWKTDGKMSLKSLVNLSLTLA